MRNLLLCAALFAASASPSVAATQETKGHSVEIITTDTHYEALARTTGTLVSGGYSIDSALPSDNPADRISVILNAPISEQSRGVGFRNDDDAPVSVVFRISLLCE